MDGESVEFPDWEVLPNEKSEEEIGPAVEFAAIESGSDSDVHGVIRSDYFSLDGQTRYASKTEEDIEEDGSGSGEGSVVSDNPSWIDPAPDAIATSKNSTDCFWSDSSTDPGAELDLINGKETKAKSFSESSGDDLISDPGYGNNNNAKMVMAETGEDGDKERSSVAVVEELKSGSDGDGGGGGGGDAENKRIVWWKVPFELIKYCVVRVSPVWSFSVAAAFIGVIILGRRLYKMKRRTQSLKLKVAVDDKKVSQFMGRAARLNEAFSVVRRVPIIRPSLPPSGVTPWPVMSMR